MSFSTMLPTCAAGTPSGTTSGDEEGVVAGCGDGGVVDGCVVDGCGDGMIVDGCGVGTIVDGTIVDGGAEGTVVDGCVAAAGEPGDDVTSAGVRLKTSADDGGRVGFCPICAPGRCALPGSARWRFAL